MDGAVGLIFSVFLLVALSALAPTVQRFVRGWTGLLLALGPASLFAWFATQIPAVARGETLEAALRWAPSIDIALTMRLDGLALLFALLICGIGALIVAYAGAYLHGHHQIGRFYCFLILFMASMLGLVLADNLIAIFVFWELTSISSYLLIGFDHRRTAARKAALQALLVTGAGGLALLAGLVLMGIASGSWELSEILASGDVLREHALYTPILILVLAGAFTKSAQFPFHFWLPNAMEAPTPVSAYLHSSTMVKAGVYILARMHPTLGGTDSWIWALSIFGAVTMVLGAWLALQNNQLKRVLAYSTVSSLGAMVMLLGIGTPLAAKAAIAFILAHALYKGALFMVAGTIDHETGEKNTEKLGGLVRLMPATAAVSIIAAVSMAGLPPLFGFVGKEVLLEATLESPTFSTWLVAASVAMAALTVAAAILVAVKPFIGAHLETPKKAHDPPLAMQAGPAILALFTIALGLAPQFLAGPIVGAGASSVLGEQTEVKLALWHGLTPALGFSALAVLLGVGLYFGRAGVRGVGAALGPIDAVGPARGYDAAMASLNLIASAQTRILQSGYLRNYLIILIISTAGLVGFTLFARHGVPEIRVQTIPNFYEVGLAILVVVGALIVVVSRSRLGAIAALGLVGYSVGLIYVLYGAPDLAMTQFAIETLTVILFVLVFYHLPAFATYSGKRERLRDMLVALIGGAMMTVLVLLAVEIQVDEPVSDYFIRNSAPKAYGHNIVNVILVDFRVLDTLGEILVLAVAAIGVHTLLRLRPDRRARR